MTNGNNFAVIGCPRCRRILAADLAYDTKTCLCGHKIDLHTASHLVDCDSGEAAAAAVRQLQERNNTGFTSAAKLAAAGKNELADNAENRILNIYF